MSNVSDGRHVFLVGLDCPYWTRGFDPDSFALRVQQLMIELAPHASLDPAVAVNPYAEWWQSSGIANLLYTRFAMMSAAAVWTDGTVSMERFATLFAQAFRESGAGGEVVVSVLVANMLRCETVVRYSASDFGGCCIQAPVVTAVAPLTIPGDRSGFRLLTRTTRPQGVRSQPVPTAIEPGSLSPVPTNPPTPSSTPVYSGTPDDPHILPDNPSGGPPRDSGTPWWKWAIGTTTVAALALLGVSVVRKRQLSDASGDGPSLRGNPAASELPAGWSVAKGSAGYNVRGPVYGKYVNGVALFAFRSSGSEQPFFNCIVVGHMSMGDSSLEGACRKGQAFAEKNGVQGSDRRLSRKQFQARMDDPNFLPVGG